MIIESSVTIEGRPNWGLPPRTLVLVLGHAAERVALSDPLGSPEGIAFDGSA